MIEAHITIMREAHITNMREAHITNMWEAYGNKHTKHDGKPWKQAPLT